ncbi:hypothetical protein ACQ4PT_063496 [Festuca glaucescens]
MGSTAFPWSPESDTAKATTNTEFPPADAVKGRGRHARGAAQRTGGRPSRCSSTGTPCGSPRASPCCRPALRTTALARHACSRPAPRTTHPLCVLQADAAASGGRQCCKLPAVDMQTITGGDANCYHNVMDDNDMDVKEMVADNMAPGDIAAKDMDVEDLAPADMGFEGMAAEDMVVGDMAVEDMAAEDMGSKGMAAGDVAGGDIVVEDMSGEDKDDKDMDGKYMNDKSQDGNDMDGKDMNANDKDDIAAKDIDINSYMDCKSIIKMTFKSENEAYMFYLDYAKRKTFGVRKDDLKFKGSKENAYRQDACVLQTRTSGPEHFDIPDPKRKQRALSRCGCGALLQVEL